MYCKFCGKIIDDNASFCPECGGQLRGFTPAEVSEDKPSTGFSILGFFVPLAGLILYLVYENKKPLRAKSAGKGALIGFVTAIVVSIVAAIVSSIFVIAILKGAFDAPKPDRADAGYTDIFYDDDVDVSFGEFSVSDDGSETSLEVTVTNKSDDRESFFIAVEAVDNDNTRIGTDTVRVRNLNPGQETRVKIFETIPKNSIDEYEQATFRVIDIDE